MLNRIDLYDFKCFDLLKLPLANLTLLSGANAAGKSSVLQALVLLHQTMLNHEWSTRLVLNGDNIKMGTVGDVVDKVHGRHVIEMGIIDGEHSYHWQFSSGDRSEMSMKVEHVTVDGVKTEQPMRLKYLLPLNYDNQTTNLVELESDNSMAAILALNPDALAYRLCRLTYITAERIGPREFYPIEETATVVGATGEYALSVLHLGRDERILDSLMIEGIAPTRLRQAEAWMREFFPGCGLEVLQVPQANAVTLGLRTSADTSFHRPIHVGFGLTQILPIIIAALSASKGDILLIENPEVHLHPGGQARMGQFLAQVAKAGVQVIIETHSDHVLNGIRRAVKDEQLTPEQVALHFFLPRSEDRPQVVSPQLAKTGNIDNWPEGFFDQFDKDMNYFANWGG
jgi:predicted ATPase